MVCGDCGDVSVTADSKSDADDDATVSVAVVIFALVCNFNIQLFAVGKLYVSLADRLLGDIGTVVVGHVVVVISEGADVQGF